MYKKIAISLTESFIRRNILDEEKREICTYGFEMIIANLTYFLIFIATAVVTKTVLDSFFFWLGLFLIRRIAGGHHSDSYFSCHCLSTLNHILFIVLIKYIPMSLFHYCSYSISIVAILSLIFFAPVDHKNKPFIKTEFARFRKYSLIYSFILTIVTLLYYLGHCFGNIPFNVDSFIFSYSFGTLSATVSLLSAKIIRYKERKCLK